MADVSLRAYVQTFAATCPQCGAPLAPDRDECPKCRTHLQLGLRVRDTYLAAWGMALGGTLIMAGYGLFLTFLVILRHGLFGPQYFWKNVVVWSICGMGPLMAIAALYLLRKRQNFCRLPRLIQSLIGLGMLGLDLLTGALFMLTITH